MDGIEDSGPKLWHLKNGMQVLVQRDRRFPLAVMRIYVRAGSALEEERESGLSHLLEHMAFRSGDSDRGAAAEIEALGGRVNAATGFDYTTYMLDLPAKAWRRGLQILRRLCLDMEWNESDLATEKEVVLSELERRQDDPGAMLFEGMQSRVWAGSAYARPIAGSQETVRDLGPEDAREYVQRLYQPQAMLLVVCGDVDEAEVLREAQRQFEGCANDRPLAALAEAPPVSRGCGPEVNVVPTPWNKVYAAIGFPLPGLGSVQAPALEVLGYILGGDQSSRLPGRFKYNEGLVDEVAASTVLFRGAGMLLVQAYLDPDRVDAFVRECLEELTGPGAADFTREETERAVDNIQDSVLQSRETLAGLATKLGYFQFLEDGLQAERRFMHQLRRMRPEDLTEPVRGYLVPDNASVTLLVGSSRADAFQDLADGLARESGGRAACGPSVSRTMSEETRVTDLGHGCRLVLIPDRTLPYQAVDLTWLGGDLLLGEGEQGLAALAAEGLLRGTRHRSHENIRELLSRRAASLDASAGRDQFSLNAKFPSRYQEEVLDLLQEAVLEPALAPEEAVRAAAEQKARLTERMDRPMGLMAREVFPFLFREHPYGYYHLGRPEELDGFGAEALRGFWERQMRQPFVLTVCGDMDEDLVKERARALAGTAARAQGIAVGEPAWSRERELHLGLDQRNQAHILVVFPVPGLGSEVYPHLALWKRILAGQDGILFRELRDRQGLGYAVNPLLWNAMSCGFLGFYLGTYPDGVDPALESFRRIVEDLGASGVERQEMDRAKNMYQADYYRGLQPLMARSGEASELLAHGLPLDFQQRTAERVAGLEQEEMREVAGRYLRWDRAYTVLLRPE